MRVVLCFREDPYQYYSSLYFIWVFEKNIPHVRKGSSTKNKISVELLRGARETLQHKLGRLVASKKPKPKSSRRLMRTKVYFITSRWALEVKTSTLLEARENANEGVAHVVSVIISKGGSRIFLRRGCTT